jgi:predicted ATPase
MHPGVTKSVAGLPSAARVGRMLLILTGSSCSGKTTLARALGDGCRAWLSMITTRSAYQRMRTRSGGIGQQNSGSAEPWSIKTVAWMLS